MTPDDADIRRPTAGGALLTRKLRRREKRGLPRDCGQILLAPEFVESGIAPLADAACDCTRIIPWTADIVQARRTGRTTFRYDFDKGVTYERIKIFKLADSRAKAAAAFPEQTPPLELLAASIQFRSVSALTVRLSSLVRCSAVRTAPNRAPIDAPRTNATTGSRMRGAIGRFEGWPRRALETTVRKSSAVAVPA